MARAFAAQSALNLDHLGFEERLGLLVEHEVSERDGKALALRLQRAKLKPNTAAEDTDYHHARGLDTALYQRLLAGLWLQEKQNVLLTGATGWARPGWPARWRTRLAAWVAAPITYVCRACSTNWPSAAPMAVT